MSTGYHATNHHGGPDSYGGGSSAACGKGAGGADGVGSEDGETALGSSPSAWLSSSSYMRGRGCPVVMVGGVSPLLTLRLVGLRVGCVSATPARRRRYKRYSSTITTRVPPPEPTQMMMIWGLHSGFTGFTGAGQALHIDGQTDRTP
eukprot:m.17288 g.17288  ORF g.17288 m.17288 type:complete len:147 (+) comp9267_c0_seq1:190-630(+)